MKLNGQIACLPSQVCQAAESLRDLPHQELIKISHEFVLCFQTREKKQQTFLEREQRVRATL